jgi:integrase
MIKKQKNGTYTVTYSTRNKRGQKVKKMKSGITSLTMAKRVEADFIAELKSKKEGYDYAGLTFEKFFNNHYIPHCERSCTDADDVMKTVNKWCQSIYKVKIDAITPNDISQILVQAANDLAYTTLKKLKSFISRVFIHAVHGGLKSNPCRPIKIPKRKEKTQPRVLTKDESNLLLKHSAALNPVWYKIWAFHLFTGMRSGEGYALLKTDVDMEKGTISVNKSWDVEKGVKCTKTGEWRVVPIAKTIKPLLVELLTDHTSGEYLLPHPWQWRTGKQALVLKNFCKEIGITPVKFHDLRATFITQMFASGGTIAEVQAIVGHNSLRTTKIYLRLSGVCVKGATDKLSFSLPSFGQGNNVVSLKDRMVQTGT